MPREPQSRHRPVYALATVAVVALGLASRRFPGLFPAFLGKYPGDALWALMVFLGLACIFPRWPTGRLAATALAISWAIELSQLYHAPFLDDIRRTTLGHLVLGSSFFWPDLVAYAAGIAVAVLAEQLLPRRRPDR